MSGAGGFPNWLLLESFVFLRNDDDSFPDETKAPIRASGITTSNVKFRIAFSLAEPPHISRVYAQLMMPVPKSLGCRRWTPLSIVGTHRHLALVRVSTETSRRFTVQNFFIFNADENPSSLKVLPPCTQPPFDYTRDSDSLPPRRLLPNARLLNIGSLGLWCRGEEFVVAELTIFKPINRPKAFADICFLHSRCTSDGDQLGGMWDSKRVRFLSSDNPEDVDLWQITCWFTDTIIPFDKWLCWVDYHRGILFCDMSKLPNLTVSFIWFPLDELPRTRYRPDECSFFYRGVSVVDHGCKLKFVRITRHDGIPFGALTPDTSFTITCHTLVSDGGSMAWKEDYTVTSGELWDANPPERLPRGILMFPRVDIDRSNVAHFLFIEFGCVNKMWWVASIDMSTKIVESFSLYINGDEGLKTDDAHFYLRSRDPRPFLPCEFPKFLNLSRKRKHMD